MDKVTTAELTAWLRDKAKTYDDMAGEARDRKNIFLVKDCEEERDNYNEAADRLGELESDNGRMRDTIGYIASMRTTCTGDEWVDINKIKKKALQALQHKDTNNA